MKHTPTSALLDTNKQTNNLVIKRSEIDENVSEKERNYYK